MKILSYTTKTQGSGWSFSEVKFQSINLLVGDSSTGKTKFLNTIFNLGCFAVNKSQGNQVYSGSWEIEVEQEEAIYRWTIHGEQDREEPYILKERIIKKYDGEETVIVERDGNSFSFNGQKLPKLSKRETSISLLREEELISPLFQGFASIMRRSFFKDELNENTKFVVIDRELEEKIKKNREKRDVFHGNFPLNAKLFLLKTYFSEIYSEICQYYKDVFTFIKKVDIKDLSNFQPNFFSGRVPVFCIKEKNVDKWIPVSEFSSGMIKVLLILVDICTLPDGGIYLMDEYENSLGISAIDFFPDLLSSEIGSKNQVIVTSHHPYIINKIPIKHWFMFHRVGSNVNIKFGEELVERFGKSKQEAFIQLINDPIYAGGAE